MKLLNCPFCGVKPNIEDPDTLYPTGIRWRYTPEGYKQYLRLKDSTQDDSHVWGFHCSEQAGGCGVEIVADTKQEAIDKWNRRI